MTVRPIIFSGPMVRALLDGSKTQTRRILNPQPRTAPIRQQSGKWTDGVQIGDTQEMNIRFAPGDLLYVRETHWRLGRWMMNGLSETGLQKWTFKASSDTTAAMFQEPQVAFKGRVRGEGTERWWKRPAIFMPRALSRITLEVTGVKVERVQDISLEDAIAEGIKPLQGGATSEFAVLWNTLNKKRGFGWAVNPWVVAVSFRVHKCNVDSMEKTA